MNTFVPQPWLSPRGDGPKRPLSMHINVNLPSDANQFDTAILMRFAQEIVEHYSAQLDRFIANNRQQQALSFSTFSEKFFKGDKLSARWRFNWGDETLEIEVYPAGGQEEGASTVDTNLDGYLCWIHLDPGWPDLNPYTNVSHAPGPFILAMNGYVIEQSFAITGPCIGYPILFGKTALLCSSYVGDVEKKNPLLSESFKLPNLVIPPGGWGKYSNGASPTGVPQIPIQKTLGYWIFDWDNPHNPFQYLRSPGFEWQNWNSFLPSRGLVGVGDPVLSKGMYFASSQPDKSPLNPKGMNSFGVTSLSQFQEQVPAGDFIYGEFYSRGKYRKAVQSWKVPIKSQRAVRVNDSPLMFGAGSFVYDYSGNNGGGLTFNLSPAATDHGNPSDDNILDIHGGISLDATGQAEVGFNDDQYAAFSAWQDDCITANQAAQVQDTQIINVRLDAYNAKWGTDANKKLLNEAQNVRTTLSAMTDALGNLIRTDAPITVTDDAGNVYNGPTQKYWFAWDLPSGAIMAQFPLYYGIYGIVTGPIFFENPTPPLASGHTFANTGDPMTYAAFYAWATVYTKTDAIAQQSADYSAIYTGLPQPVYPPFPALAGGSIDSFDHSNIAISNGSWSYEQ